LRELLFEGATPGERVTAYGKATGSQFVCHLTSNDPLLNILKKSDALRNALDSRLVTFILDADNEHGVLSKLARGINNPAEQAERIIAHVSKNYGAALVPFLKRLVKERQKDEAGLIRQIGRFIDEFLRKVGIDGSDGVEKRRALAIGYVFAGLRLARKWRVFPSKDHLGPLFPVCEHAWRVAQETRHKLDLMEPDQVIFAYVKRRHTKFGVVEKKLQELSDQRFNEHPGFLKVLKSGKQELILSEHRFASLGLSKPAIKKLVSAELLVRDAERTTVKRTVRRKDGETIKERAKVIDLHKRGAEITEGKLLKRK